MPRALARCSLPVATAVLLAFAAATAPGAAAEEKKPAPRQANRQAAGDIQKAGEIQRIEEQCHRRLVVAADALFAFDRDELSPQAEKTLAALGPQLEQAAGKMTIEGHTDAVGPEDYNRALSLRRARAVRNWLAAHDFAPANTPIAGFGEAKPVAANTHADGSDDPQERQKNRRVEVVIRTCPPD